MDLLTHRAPPDRTTRRPRREPAAIVRATPMSDVELRAVSSPSEALWPAAETAATALLGVTSLRLASDPPVRTRLWCCARITLSVAVSPKLISPLSSRSASPLATGHAASRIVQTVPALNIHCGISSSRMRESGFRAHWKTGVTPLRETRRIQTCRPCHGYRISRQSLGWVSCCRVCIRTCGYTKRWG